MRKIFMLLLLAIAARPTFAATRVNVDQLEHLIASQHGRSDSKFAERLFSLELTERLSAEKLTHLEAEAPGPESRRALVVLADFSAFLEPPAAEISPAAAPDAATQNSIVAKAVAYVAHTMHEFPNFTATRDTIHFEDSPARQVESGLVVDGRFVPYEPMHPVSRSSASVVYRDGREVADAVHASTAQTGAPGLNTSGEFGPILGMVLVDAAHGKISWSHWEQGKSGQLEADQIAVLRYEVPREKSHYEVKFCCIAEGKNANDAFQKYPGYHGEIAISPSNGAILRLSVMADLAKADPVVKSDILVEYGQVSIGEREFICPLKSISISTGPAARVLRTQKSLGDAALLQGDFSEDSPLQTMLNETVFEQYHVFGSEMRLLMGDNNAPPMEPATSASTPASVAANQDTQAPVTTTPAAARADISEIAAPAASGSSVPAAAPPPSPEIGTAEIAALPEAPAAAASNFTLHMTTRLVDVELLALDKKGRPVQDIRPGDLELDDNGRKQTVQSFHAPNSSALPTPTAQAASDDVASQTVFSNRVTDSAENSTVQSPVNSQATILLIDPANLAWVDVQQVREQIEKFLRRLPPGDRVGFYTMNGRGFQIVVEATSDHDSVAKALQAWMPSARDVARAQDEEQHNRQQFDDVPHPSDLASVNGNSASASPLTEIIVDPNLRSFGAHPGREALLTLTGMARHLAAIAGHKDLVWVESDNVLVDWSDAAAGSDKGGTSTSNLALSAQEALNDAQVSLYPLDASRIGTMAVDPSLENASMPPSPSVAAPLPPQQGAVPPGNIEAQMQQDLRPVQAAIQQIAAGTGGRVFARSGDTAAELNEVVSAGRGAYLLGFSPDTPADDRYHSLTVKLTTRRGVTLRYRTGYFYAKEPPTLKERFRQVLWQPLDASDIAVTARPARASDGTTLYLHITTADLGLALNNGVWADKLDIFLVQRDDAGLRVHVTGKTLVLRLKPDTYQRILKEDVPFDQFIAKDATASSVRMIVVDENTGRMGSVTLPAAVLLAAE